MEISRKEFVLKSALLAGGISTGINSVLKGGESVPANPKNLPIAYTDKKENFKVNVFSKTLHWLPVPEMMTFAAEIGFDGIDLTVRPNGHVLPENVEADLPKAVDAAQKAGIEIKMIATSINNAEDPLTERILKTAGELGILHYRMDWLFYNDSKSIEQNLVIIQERMGKLALLNEKYKVHGEYQNHSGKYTPNSYFGSSLWDLYTILKNINSPWLGSQFDTTHATVEGAYSWETDLKLLSPHIYSLAVKDFYWSKKNDKWAPQISPLGEGMVDFRKFFKLVRQYNIECPITLHFEYPTGGAETGARTTTMPRQEIAALMKKDVITLKNYLREENLIV